MKKTLLQVIVNTKGLSRTVSQDRDELGRFVPGARVGVLLNPGHVVHLAAQSKSTVVFVQHSYTYGQQTVTSVNRETKQGNAVTFINDGFSGGLRDSLFQNE